MAQENSEDCLQPVHPPGNQAAGDEICGDIDAEGHPQGSVVVGTPRALFQRNWCQIVIVKRRIDVAELHFYPDGSEQTRRKRTESSRKIPVFEGLKATRQYGVRMEAEGTVRTKK